VSLEEGQTAMSGLLIVYGTKEGQTGRIAERMARIAQEHGVETNVLDGKAAPKHGDRQLQRRNCCCVGAYRTP
jgi:Flavodoxin